MFWAYLGYSIPNTPQLKSQSHLSKISTHYLENKVGQIYTKKHLVVNFQSYHFSILE